MTVKLPTHIAFIMDGNGRWATSRLLPRSVGHQKGLKKAEEIIQYTLQCGIPYISLYVFSTENWKRPDNEIQSLFQLAEKYLDKFEKFCQQGIRVVFSGERAKLPQQLVDKMDKVKLATQNNNRLTVNLCINYGARNEIVRAVNKLIANNLAVTEQSLLDAVTNGLPPADMIVRTGGQMRLSNFMLYESAYAELFFLDIYWPSFSTKQYQKVLQQYSNRTRNFGGLECKND